MPGATVSIADAALSTGTSAAAEPHFDTVLYIICA